MSNAEIIERLDEILDLLAAKTDHGHGGLSEARRKLVARLVRLLKNEIAKR